MRAQQRQRKRKNGIVEIATSLEDRHIANDILAPEDFIQVYRTHLDSPERGLMVAILEQALADYQRCLSARDKEGRKRFGEAERWIMEADAEWIFSFVNCCEVLGIDPGYLRSGLLRWKRTELTKIEVGSATQQQQRPKRLFRAAA